MNSISSLRSFSSLALFLAALDIAVVFDAFDAGFFERFKFEEDVEDFFRDLDVSFEVFFVAMRRTVLQLRVGCKIE